MIDEIRSIGQTGLHYASDKYDVERYQRLLDLAVAAYADLSGEPASRVFDKLTEDIGPITPKVGSAAAIFDADGRLLLMRRHDTGKWSYPAGAGEVYEDARACAVREVREETGLVCEAGNIIEIFFRRAGDGGIPWPIWVPMIHCIPVGGQLQTTDEALEVGYFHVDEIPKDEWHTLSEHRCRVAEAYWKSLQGA